eukprot:jgi/Tetstr1/429741/TSEL_019634.t1
MSGSGSPADPNPVDAGKAAADEGVETSATAQKRIEAIEASRGNRTNSKTTRPEREAPAPQVAFAKDTTKDDGKDRETAEARWATRPNGEVLHRAGPTQKRLEDTPPGVPSKRHCIAYGAAGMSKTP